MAERTAYGVLEPVEGAQVQASWELMTWKLDVTAVTATPDSAAVAHIWKESTETDVIATVMPTATVTVSGATITLGVLRSLTAGESYRIEGTYVDGLNTRGFVIRVRCPV